MKILHVINSLAKGGAERLLVDVLPLYREHSLSVLQLSDAAASGEYLDILQRKNIAVATLSSGSLYNPQLIFQLKDFVKKGGYDVVHVHLFPSMYWSSLAFKLMGKRSRPLLVFTEHSTQNTRLNNPVFKPVDRFIYKSYDSVIAISEAIRARLIQWTHTPDKIVFIRNGVDTQHFVAALPYEPSFFEKTFGIPPGSRILLMTARFLYPKDHSTVVRALKHLPADYHLVFAGEGEKKEEVQALVNESGLDERVHFAGFRTDVASLMKSVDINILSSEYEGMSGVTLEALAAGKPFLGSDVPGINDVVPDQRFLFSAGDEASLAAAINKIGHDDDTVKRKMIGDGILFAQGLDVSVMIKQHIALYTHLMQNRKTKK